MEASLLQRYRHDRRKLLDFILSSGLIKEIRTSSAATSVSDINFDVLSADYVLQCIQSGGVLDIAEATRKYPCESAYPVMMQSQLVDSYFLLSDPESFGSPPRRMPPHPEVNHTDNKKSYKSDLPDQLIGRKLSGSVNEYGANRTDLSTEKDKIPSLGLPALNTGFSKDYRKTTCGNQLMKYVLHLWHFMGLKFILPRIKRKIKLLDFLLG